MKKTPVQLLRQVGWAEAVSYLLLLGVAMPLKYIWGQPLAVKVVGMFHGVLFILFCVVLLRAMLAAKWGLGRGALLFAATFVPFGPFLLDKKMKRYEEEFLKGPAA